MTGDGLIGSPQGNMTDYRCKTATGPLNAIVQAPSSRSITNRALVLSALAEGRSILSNVLFAEDTRLMIEALRRLGVAIAIDEHGGLAEVTGRGGNIPESDADLSCGNSGTTLRFLTAVASLGRGGQYRFDGRPRLRQRPIGCLAEALQEYGTGFEFLVEPGFPPFVVHAKGLRGGILRMDAPESSQMISGLLMVAPFAVRDVMIETPLATPSLPYITMTTSMMERFGVVVLSDIDGEQGLLRLIVESGQRYRATNERIEADATNAMYFLSSAAVAGGRVTISNLGASSSQGDLRFLDILEQMGCRTHREPDRLTVHGPPPGAWLRGIDVDLGDMPDSAQTLAVIALFAEGPTTIRNVASLRIKETDRIAALQCELQKLGATVEVREDEIRITPPDVFTPALIETYDDHRMAMSFALAGLRCPGIILSNHECVDKTFPFFFREFESLLHPAASGLDGPGALPQAQDR